VWLEEFVKDSYLDELKNEFNGYSAELKKMRKSLLKSSSLEEQSEIILKIDKIAKKMEKNQRQSTKVTKSRLKEIKKQI